MRRLAILFLLVFPRTWAAELQQDTLRAWNQYIDARVADLEERVRAAGESFLWSEQSAERMARLKRGEIVVAPMVRESGFTAVPNGLIHHWIGAAFLPNAHLADVLAVSNDYERYGVIYAPSILGAKLTSRQGNLDRFTVRTLHKVLFVTAVMDTDYESRTTTADGNRTYVISQSAAIHDVENYRQADERVLPADRGSGYVWRLATISRYEQIDGGVLVETEALGLTRTIPLYLRSLVRPIAAKLSRNSLQTTLIQTRRELEAISASNPPARMLSRGRAAVAAH
jgi:hypothetical protein